MLIFKSKGRSLNTPAKLLALFFGSGCPPVAPGTFGTLAAIPLYWLMRDLDAVSYTLVCMAVFSLGIWACDRAAKQMGVHDHPSIVLDEVAGYLVTMAFIPFSIGAIVSGFILFRIFDILKPWPIRWIDKQVHGGFGIMLDDLLAGIFANLSLWVVVLWFFV